MSFKKNDVVRIVEAGRQIGDYFRVTSIENKRFLYCNVIKGGVTQENNYYMRKVSLAHVPYTGIVIPIETMEDIKKNYYPQQAIVLPYTPRWNDIIKRKKEEPSMVIHLATNDKQEQWFKFVSVVRTTTNNMPTITLFGVEYVS